MLKRLAALLLFTACAPGAPRCRGRTPDAWLPPELAAARKADYDGKYDLALNKVAEYLRYHGGVDEALAWEIRGSTYYLMGKPDDARSAWKQAYALDPCLTEIPDLLKKLDAKP